MKTSRPGSQNSRDVDDSGVPPVQDQRSTSMVDHSFTLQAIMEVQKTLGNLDGKLGAVADRLDKLENRVSSLDDKLSGVTHKLYAAGVVLAIALAVGGFLLNKSWDRALDLLANQIKQGQQHP